MRSMICWGRGEVGASAGTGMAVAVGSEAGLEEDWAGVTDTCGCGTGFGK